MEVVAVHLELGNRRNVGPVDDGDTRQLASAEPLLVRREQDVEDAMSSGDRGNLVSTRKGTHDGEVDERIAQRVAVRSSGGRLRIVLRELHLAVFVDDEGVEP